MNYYAELRREEKEHCPQNAQRFAEEEEDSCPQISRIFAEEEKKVRPLNAQIYAEKERLDKLLFCVGLRDLRERKKIIAR
ncbi:MAG: hypothetical protein H6536_09455 [Bacteroidales bacterium]|nr:hypothetical protein [Bacteroidales bacterium]